ncbi:MAG: glycoside hydrolase family 16 protein [Bacteroidaceae bacterium]|nr:glycoside hydrolase family 16 protein [Bacteroidaceae bacterium]
MKRYIFLAFASLSLGANAQTFETGDASYSAVSTYDSWTQSPFRTGTLSGNAKVVDNPFKTDNNKTEKCLAYQRSRWASNMYGARVDLAEPFELSPKAQYVHALVHRPKEGRLMCIGLGRQRGNTGQSLEVEQFFSVCTQHIGADEWYDAVFAVRGAGNIDIHSLVFVTDLERTDALTEDHIAYIDEVTLNGTPSPRTQNGYYSVAVPEGQLFTRSDRYLNSFRLTGSQSGEYTVNVGNAAPNYVYRSMLERPITLHPGEDVTLSVGYVGTWMNAFVYLDENDNGQFDVPLEEMSASNPLPEGTEILAYSFVENEPGGSGYNSEGKTISGNGRSTLSVPSFKIPASLKHGFYRMRVKVDWANADPAGRMGDSNDIVSNGGAIVDIMVNVMTEKGTANQDGLNGDLCTVDGHIINNVEFECGKTFTLRQEPAPGFVAGPVTVRYGYNLDGAQTVHDNPQWFEHRYIRSTTDTDGVLTIDAAYTIGDMRLQSDFIEAAKAEEEDDDYRGTLNFDPDTLMNLLGDRRITALTVKGEKGSWGMVTGWNTDAPFATYANASDQTVTVSAGEELTVRATTVNSKWMYGYIYIDYNRNGSFELTGIAPVELVSQSTGGEDYANMPSFTIPASLTPGCYRIRFKTDWDCNDPGGRYGEKWPPSSSTNTNYINDNRGQIIDFTLHVGEARPDTYLREETEHCSLFSPDGSQLPSSLGGSESVTFMVAPMTDYVMDGTIDVVSEAGTVSFDTLPEDGILTAQIKGDALIRAHFKQGPEATWHCIFNDEFNKDNYTWDTKDWNTTVRSSPTWCRFNSNDPKDSVAVQNNGYLSLTSKTIGDREMRTGNLMTQNLHNFTYGRVEARCKVYPHTGNFPAFWMMPVSQKPNYSGEGTWGGWPHSGEIDIMEQIDNENKAYHTIHSHWANGAGEGGMGQTYQKTASEYVDMNRKWHIYAVEWDAEQLRWYVDGRHVHTYDRIAAKDNDSDRQWPFDRPFYVIINQSVGNGSWAKSPDFGFTYRMDVDYVRVYQRCEPTAVREVTATEHVDVYGGEGRIVVNAPVETRLTVVGLSGALVFDGRVSGTLSIPAKAGVYIAGGKKVVVK